MSVCSKILRRRLLLSEMADSSVNFIVRPWVKPADYWGVYFDTMEAIKKKIR